MLYPAHLVLVSYLSCFLGLAAAAYVLLRRLGLPRFACFALAWLGGEQLKSMGEMGFPWLSIGYVWFRTPELIQWAAWGGVAAVSAWTALVNGLVVEAGFARGVRRSALALAAAVLVSLAAWQTGARSLARVRPGPEVRIALVQPNISGDIKWDAKYLRRNLAAHIRLTREVAREKPQLIIWPETAIPTYLRYDLESFHAVTDMLAELRIPLLTGFPDARMAPGHARPLSYNSAAVLDSTGRLRTVYDKIHLVPFGERMPFQKWLPFLGRLDFGQAEWIPGERPTILESGPVRAGMLICFESIFPEPSGAEVRAGANLLVNITNDEWFGPNDAPWQHAAMAVFRAVENRVGLVRCANTGISFFVDPGGRIRDATPAFETRLVVASAQLGLGESTFTRRGNWFAMLMLWACLVGSALGLVRGRLTPR